MRIYDVDPYTSKRGVVKESAALTATEWTTDGLTPATDYRADVESYSDSCDNYSYRPARKKFTTNANSSPSDPQRSDDEAKYVPTTPSGGRIERQGTYNVRVWWNRPPNGGENTCSHTDYSVELFRGNRKMGEADEKTNRNHIFDSAYRANREYTLKVASYSAECDEWSRYLTVTTTLP